MAADLMQEHDLSYETVDDLKAERRGAPIAELTQPRHFVVLVAMGRFFDECRGHALSRDGSTTPRGCDELAPCTVTSEASF